MKVQDLAQQILTMAQEALNAELKEAIYINDDPGKCEARSGLEAIIKLCREVPPASQEDFRHYEKKEKVKHDARER